LSAKLEAASREKARKMPSCQERPSREAAKKRPEYA